MNEANPLPHVRVNFGTPHTHKHTHTQLLLFIKMINYLALATHEI